MSGEKIDNVAALAELDRDESGNLIKEKGRHAPKRWAGVVKANHGLAGKKDQSVGGLDMFSGEWFVEIEPKSLIETVFARVNEDRAEGAKVQFNLLAQDNDEEIKGVEVLGSTGKVAGATWFEKNKGVANDDWRQGMSFD